MRENMVEERQRERERDGQGMRNHQRAHEPSSLLFSVVLPLYLFKKKSLFLYNIEIENEGERKHLLLFVTFAVCLLYQPLYLSHSLSLSLELSSNLRIEIYYLDCAIGYDNLVKEFFFFFFFSFLFLSVSISLVFDLFS